MSLTFEAFATCKPDLEPLVAAELAALGAAPRPTAGGVAFEADRVMIMRAGLRLGCASHVLLRLAEFPCRALGELERKSAKLAWANWLRADVPFTVRATTRASRVYHTGAIAERIANTITGSVDTRPASNESADDVARLTVRFRNDVCTISLDTTTTPLHRRGYRLASAKAPLREDLAHALVLTSGFGSELALFDPFCGSGTIAIEAAGIARGLAPGRLRPPPMQHLALFDESDWSTAAQPTDARDRLAPIAANDRDAGAIEMARANAERAGVADDIDWHCGAFTAHPWMQPENAPARGVVVTNPPFGKRVADANKLLHLYQSLGHRVTKLGPHWQATLLAHELRLARRTALDLTAAFTTRHGGLAVTALTTQRTTP